MKTPTLTGILPLTLQTYKRCQHQHLTSAMRRIVALLIRFFLLLLWLLNPCIVWYKIHTHSWKLSLKSQSSSLLAQNLRCHAPGNVIRKKAAREDSFSLMAGFSLADLHPTQPEHRAGWVHWCCLYSYWALWMPVHDLRGQPCTRLSLLWITSSASLLAGPRHDIFSSNTFLNLQGQPTRTNVQAC